MTAQSSLLTYARSYRAAGLSILRTDGKKSPLHGDKWKHLQTTPIDVADLPGYLAEPGVGGLAIICGAVSGGLEVIDVDTKHAASPDALFPELVQAIMAIDPALFPRLVVARTPSGGYHLIYRCTEVAVCGNTAIALRQMAGNELQAAQDATDQAADAASRKRHKVDPVKCFIETRGEGGYIAAAPTPGYAFEQGDMAAVPVLSAAERESLWAAAFSLSTYTKPIEVRAPRATADQAPGITPLDDYNERGDVVALLVTHGWTFVRQQGEKSVMLRPGTTDSKSSGDYHAGKRLFTVFTTSTQFEALRGYNPAAVYAFLEHAGDFSAAARALYAEGYGARHVKPAGTSVNDALRANMNADRESELLTFWAVVEEEKKGKIVKVTTIVHHKFLEFLHAEGGFGVYRYDPTTTGYVLIRVTAGVVTEVSSEHIRKFALEYIHGLPKWFDGIHHDTLLEVFLKNEKILKSVHLEFLPRISPVFLRDTSDMAYYPFRNGVVCINRQGVAMQSLDSLGKCIWATQIKDRDILIEDDIDPTGIEFYKFISKICADDPERMTYCMSLMGYLLHGYKKASNSFCVIMCEETETKGGIGGTGKGILWKGLGELVPKVFLDGKSPKLTNNNFVYERVKPDTKLLIIDDCVKNLNFEAFFTPITEGVVVEKKHQGEVFIPYEDAPKLIFTTNYVIDAGSTAAKRRIRTLEFARFFHQGNTPKQLFGHELFADWDAAEWNRFFNLLFACVQSYLRFGVPIRDESMAIRRRALMEKYGETVLSWWDDYQAEDGRDWRLFSEIYAGFLESENVDAKYYSAKKFRAFLEACAGLYGVAIEERKNRSMQNKKQIKVKAGDSEPVAIEGEAMEVDSSIF